MTDRLFDADARISDADRRARARAEAQYLANFLHGWYLRRAGECEARGDDQGAASCRANAARCRALWSEGL